MNATNVSIIEFSQQIIQHMLIGLSKRQQRCAARSQSKSEAIYKIGIIITIINQRNLKYHKNFTCYKQFIKVVGKHKNYYFQCNLFIEKQQPYHLPRCELEQLDTRLINCFIRYNMFIDVFTRQQKSSPIQSAIFIKHSNIKISNMYL